MSSLVLLKSILHSAVRVVLFSKCKWDLSFLLQISASKQATHLKNLISLKKKKISSQPQSHCPFSITSSCALFPFSNSHHSLSSSLCSLFSNPYLTPSIVHYKFLRAEAWVRQRCISHCTHLHLPSPIPNT